MPRLIGGATWGKQAWHRPDWTPKPRNDIKQSHKAVTQQKRVAIDPPQSESPTNDKLIGICISCDPSTVVSISPLRR